MARVSTYLNFPRCTEEAFGMDRSVFGGEFNGAPHHFGEMPPCQGQPPLSEADWLFNGLSAGSQLEMPLQDMLWGAYFGSLTGRYGVRWTVNCMARS